MKYKGIITNVELTFKRVWITGTIIKVLDKGKYVDIIINNGIGDFTIRIFENELFNFPSLEEGQIILVLGSVREFRNKKYIHPDFITTIKPEVELLLKIPLVKKAIFRGIKVKEEKAIAEKKVKEDDKEIIKIPADKKRIVDIRKEILKILEEEDKGEGVDISILYEKINMPIEVIERVVEELKMYGFVYEPTPGKLKILK